LGKAFLLGTRTAQADIEDSRASPQAPAKFRGQEGAGQGGEEQEQVEVSQAAADVLAASSLPHQPATQWVAAYRRGQNTQQRVPWVGVGGEPQCIFSHMAAAGPSCC